MLKGNIDHKNLVFIEVDKEKATEAGIMVKKNIHHLDKGNQAKATGSQKISDSITFGELLATPLASIGSPSETE